MVCILCHFDVLPDDVAVGGDTGRVVCIRCFARETGGQHPMPKGLRRELEAATDALARESKWGID